MALLTSELARIKYHLGFTVLSVGAEPRIDVVAIFEQIVQPYLAAGASTTSATTVTASTAGAVPVTLTLASATGFAAKDHAIVDVGTRQERAQIQNVSGSTIVLGLQLAHSGTYPVTVEGPESIVRDLVRRCDLALDAYRDAVQSAGLKMVDNGGVEWFPEGGGGPLTTMRKALAHWRGELASALGLSVMSQSGGAPRSFEIY